MRKEYEISYVKGSDKTILEEIWYYDDGNIASCEIVSFVYGDGYTVEDLVKDYEYLKSIGQNPLKAEFEEV